MKVAHPKGLHMVGFPLEKANQGDSKNIHGCLGARGREGGIVGDFWSSETILYNTLMMDARMPHLSKPTEHAP